MKQFISKYGMFIIAPLNIIYGFVLVIVCCKTSNETILEIGGIIELVLFVLFMYCAKLYNDAFNEYLKTIG